MARKKRDEADPRLVTAQELEKGRNQLVRVIVEQTPKMVERLLRSASERGDLAAIRYLWEVAGFLPQPAEPAPVQFGQYLDDPDEGCSLPDVKSEGSQVK